MGMKGAFLIWGMEGVGISVEQMLLTGDGALLYTGRDGRDVEEPSKCVQGVPVAGRLVSEGPEKGPAAERREPPAAAHRASL
jgi:hypothetical protein